jgi:hypothetical protein
VISNAPRNPDPLTSEGTERIMAKPTPQLTMMSDQELNEADRALFRRQGNAKTVIGYESDGRVASKGGAYAPEDTMVSRAEIRAEKKRRGLK